MNVNKHIKLIILVIFGLLIYLIGIIRITNENVIKQIDKPLLTKFPESLLKPFLNNYTIIDNPCINYNIDNTWRYRDKLKVGDHYFNFALFGNNDIVSNNIFKYSKWEEENVKTILKALTDISLLTNNNNISFIDIGSNIGWFTVIIAKHGWNTISFEPMNENINIISRNICNNNISNKIDIYHIGLGNKEEKCWLVSGEINIGDGVLICGKKPSYVFKKDGYVYKIRQEINVNKLDDYKLNNPIGVMKIDVEGYEENVLRQSLFDLMYEMDYFIASPFCEYPLLNKSHIFNYINKYNKYSDICFVHKKSL